MNTASLELCKELFELSGWDYPAYDLGSLLRKLPRDFVLRPIPGAQWEIQYAPGMSGKEKICQADTPEDAACSLAIYLFKEGILEREG
jgi:hypothetical protein